RPTPNEDDGESKEDKEKPEDFEVEVEEEGDEETAPEDEPSEEDGEDEETAPEDEPSEEDEDEKKKTEVIVHETPDGPIVEVNKDGKKKAEVTTKEEYEKRIKNEITKKEQEIDGAKKQLDSLIEKGGDQKDIDNYRLSLALLENEKTRLKGGEIKNQIENIENSLSKITDPEVKEIANIELGELYRKRAQELGNEKVTDFQRSIPHGKEGTTKEHVYFKRDENGKVTGYSFDNKDFVGLDYDPDNFDDMSSDNKKLIKRLQEGKGDYSVLEQEAKASSSSVSETGLNPNSPQMQQRNEFIERSKASYESAMKSTDPTIRGNADIQWARTHELENPEIAVQRLNRISQDSGYSKEIQSDALRHSAEISIQNGKSKEALNNLNEALAKDPNNLNALDLKNKLKMSILQQQQNQINQEMSRLGQETKSLFPTQTDKWYNIPQQTWNEAGKALFPERLNEAAEEFESRSESLRREQSGIVGIGSLVQGNDQLKKFIESDIATKRSIIAQKRGLDLNNPNHVNSINNMIKDINYAIGFNPNIALMAAEGNSNKASNYAFGVGSGLSDPDFSKFNEREYESSIRVSDYLKDQLTGQNIAIFTGGGAAARALGKGAKAVGLEGTANAIRTSIGETLALDRLGKVGGFAASEALETGVGIAADQIVPGSGGIVESVLGGSRIFEATNNLAKAGIKSTGRVLVDPTGNTHGLIHVGSELELQQTIDSFKKQGMGFNSNTNTFTTKDGRKITITQGDKIPDELSSQGFTNSLDPNDLPNAMSKKLEEQHRLNDPNVDPSQVPSSDSLIDRSGSVGAAKMTESEVGKFIDHDEFTNVFSMKKEFDPKTGKEINVLGGDNLKKIDPKDGQEFTLSVNGQNGPTKIKVFATRDETGKLTGIYNENGRRIIVGKDGKIKVVYDYASQNQKYTLNDYKKDGEGISIDKDSNIKLTDPKTGNPVFDNELEKSISARFDNKIVEEKRVKELFGEDPVDNLKKNEVFVVRDKNGNIKYVKSNEELKDLERRGYSRVAGDEGVRFFRGADGNVYVLKEGDIAKKGKEVQGDIRSETFTRRFSSFIESKVDSNLNLPNSIIYKKGDKHYLISRFEEGSTLEQMDVIDIPNFLNKEFTGAGEGKNLRTRANLELMRQALGMQDINNRGVMVNKKGGISIFDFEHTGKAQSLHPSAPFADMSGFSINPELNNQKFVNELYRQAEIIRDLPDNEYRDFLRSSLKDAGYVDVSEAKKMQEQLRSIQKLRQNPDYVREYGDVLDSTEKRIRDQGITLDSTFDKDVDLNKKVDEIMENKKFMVYNIESQLRWMKSQGHINPDIDTRSIESFIARPPPERPVDWRTMENFPFFGQEGAALLNIERFPGKGMIEMNEITNTVTQQPVGSIKNLRGYQGVGYQQGETSIWQGAKVELTKPIVITQAQLDSAIKASRNNPEKLYQALNLQRYDLLRNRGPNMPQYSPESNTLRIPADIVYQTNNGKTVSLLQGSSEEIKRLNPSQAQIDALKLYTNRFAQANIEESYKRLQYIKGNEFTPLSVLTPKFVDWLKGEGEFKPFARGSNYMPYYAIDTSDQLRQYVLKRLDKIDVMAWHLERGDPQHIILSRGHVTRDPIIRDIFNQFMNKYGKKQLKN
ncbi:MAG: hypothetical protein ABIH37_02420, partial [archaeon]